MDFMRFSIHLSGVARSSVVANGHLERQLGVALEHLLNVVAEVHGFRQNLHNVGNGEVVLLLLLVSNNAHIDALNYLNNSLVAHNTPWG